MIQSEVSIDHATHTYTDTKGRNYTSVSHVLNIVEDKFDADGISKNCAGKGKYAGMTQKQVLDQWAATAKESTDHGTRVHNALERYSKKFTILDSDVDLTEMLQSVANGYAGYVRTYDECILYHPDYMVAGTADKILLPTSRSKVCDIEDYKTNTKKGIVYHSEYNKYKKFPVDHLSDCNYNRYVLQMSIYGVMFEYLTGRKVRKMWLTFIPENDPMKYHRIPAPFMKTDAINILEHFKKERQRKTSPLLLSEVYESEIPNFTY